ncbi:hypothetical protein GCM10010347_59140 [Streptomyces cirratus]|uniref:Lipoprotein n=1 Tax=Streptomyces cirratus TaxID=68187 RepID=A0ABQ3F525_9ACTN|nr:hypothetical protein GCM10010347_59140 [Streptomyces cirratus]
MGASLVLTGCGSGGDEAPVSWNRPCDMLPKAVVEKSVGVPLVAAGSEGRYGFECRYRPPKSPEDFWTVSFRSDTAGTYCPEPKSRPASEIDAEAYKTDDNGRVVVGGRYHGHCHRRLRPRPAPHGQEPHGVTARSSCAQTRGPWLSGTARSRPHPGTPDA